MTTFFNHQQNQTVTVTTTMRKIVSQLNHKCAETGEKITPGMTVYYDGDTKNYFCLHSETVKKFLLGDDLKANEETN